MSTTRMKSAPKRAAVPRKPAPAASKAKPARAAKEPMSLAQVLRELESAGTEQARKTYRRHGVTAPTFGTSFATLKALMKRIGVDHDLGLALWETGNFDAQNLAVKIIDPARMTPAQLDRWVRGSAAPMWGGYVASIAGESGHGAVKLEKWLASKETRERFAGWNLLSHLANRDESMPDAPFLERLAQIERTIHSAPNAERYAMNDAVINVGCRNAALRKAALAAARRIGTVDVDHGDTACKTPDAAAYIERCWAHAKAKGFASPAAQERARDMPRLRC